MCSKDPPFLYTMINRKLIVDFHADYWMTVIRFLFPLSLSLSLSLSFSLLSRFPLTRDPFSIISISFFDVHSSQVLSFVILLLPSATTLCPRSFVAGSSTLLIRVSFLSFSLSFYSTNLVLLGPRRPGRQTLRLASQRDIPYAYSHANRSSSPCNNTRFSATHRNACYSGEIFFTTLLEFKENV